MKKSVVTQKRAGWFYTLLLAAGLVSLSAVQAATITVSQDSYIDGRDGYLDSNFGGENVLYAGQHGQVNGGRKSYLLFDASELPLISSINFFQVQRGGGTVSRTVNVSAILGENVDSWTESAITWNSAPGNNVAAANREFVAFPGETVIRVAGISLGGATDTVYQVPFSGLLLDDMTAILNALNTGDRKLTLGLSLGSTIETSIPFRSREYGGGSSPALLDVTFVPEPAMGSLLLCGGMILLGMRGRRSGSRA